MKRLRILLLAPETDPESLCGSLLSYCQAEALARLHDVTLVIRSEKEEVVRRVGGPFHAVEVIRQRWVDGVSNWILRRVFKYNYRSQVWTALNFPFCIAFEWNAWRQLRRRITGGQFDVALRLLPVTSVLPSPFSFVLRNGPIPFVVGPVNGGLPWPQGFSQADNQKQWISNLRSLYRFLPFARSTYRHAAAIMAGSSQTYSEFAAHRERLFFLPENGISRSLCFRPAGSSERDGKLEFIFVGGLVPFKACDLALRAAAPLLREGFAKFTVVGDGPERSRLEQLTRSLGIEQEVSFCGFLKHEETLRRLRAADVLVFPSVREFGGAVVFEALAVGAVPVVVDFGGPGDIVHANVGFKASLTNENDVVAQLEGLLTRLTHDRDLLNRLRRQGMLYAQQRLTWDAKAESITDVLNWAVGRGPKPNLPPPKMLQSPDPISNGIASFGDEVPVGEHACAGGSRHPAAPNAASHR